MNMIIKMYNVGYGEYIEFYKDGKKVITVDCGSNTWANILSNHSFYDPILITHLHKDHYNGFLNYAKNNNGKFLKVYLPYISSRARGLLLKEALHRLKKYGSKSAFYSIKALSHIIQIVDPKHIIFVSAGDCISEISAEVLWPNKAILHDVNEDINSEITNSEDYRYLLQISNNIYENRDVDVRELNDRINLLEVYVNNKNKEIKETTLGCNENAYSIVFKSKSSSDFLFTGDITLKIQQCLITKHNISSVYLYKFPHHGTENYTIENNKLKFSVGLISNGGYRRSWGISSRISGFKNVICTSDYNCLSCNGTKCKYNICKNGHIVLYI